MLDDCYMLPLLHPDEAALKLHESQNCRFSEIANLNSSRRTAN
jgi:hypothetical protein